MKREDAEGYSPGRDAIRCRRTLPQPRGVRARGKADGREAAWGAAAVILPEQSYGTQPNEKCILTLLA